jgi:hypothetical protein
MTWKEFKDFVESKGLKDDSRLSYIHAYGLSGAVDERYLNVYCNDTLDLFNVRYEPF